MSGGIVSASELDRIRKLAIGQTDSDQAIAAKHEKALAMHEKSKVRAANWSNTLEGSRKKKEDDRRERIEREERERQKIDVQEARFQLEERRKAIERANKILKEQTDRIKSFHSAMMYSDVLAEREAQVRLKEELAKLEHLRDQRFEDVAKFNYQRMLERELKEKSEYESKAQETAKVQQAQLAEWKEARLAEIRDEMMEGEILRKKAAEDLQAERRAEEARRNVAIQALVETQKANAYLKEIKAHEAERVSKEERKIEEYAAEKGRQFELRKKREEEIFNKKQEMRMKMIEEQAARLAANQSNEEKRIERQVLEKEMADEAARVKKEEKMRKWMNDLEKSRNSQMEKRRKAKEAEQEMGRRMAAYSEEMFKKLNEDEREDQASRRRAAQYIAIEQKRQVAEKKRRARKESEIEATVVDRAKTVTQAEALAFHSYAQERIQEYADEGKNVIPLIKELRDYRRRSSK
ncbi:hypothetical protein FOZ60_011825 [Perkinsus olseni]|uniref:Trichohyalin-plectin-homology domain-containing protein n=2 Tax=Perkinsus olseni TaxID=32597 RepID=A0A7J6PM42_PEROL|nr:hypothetical protein FOZ60_011825 [Perkinsus olseni]